MKYFVVGALLVPANLFSTGLWAASPTPLSDFFASYNFIIWSAFVMVVWIIFAVAKAAKGAKLSWMAVAVTIAANIVSISLLTMLDSGDKTTAATFGFVLFLLPSVLVTIIITGLSRVIYRCTQRRRLRISNS